MSPLRHSFNRSYIQLPKTNIQNQLYIVMSRRTANTTVATPKYCCLFCFQKHGTIQQTWGGFVVKQVARRSTKYVHKCMGLTRHLRQSNKCSAYYSSNGLTWNRHINYKSSMLICGPHQQVHRPSAFGLSTAGNALCDRTSTSSNPHSQQIQRVVPNMLQALPSIDLSSTIL